MLIFSGRSIGLICTYDLSRKSGHLVKLSFILSSIALLFAFPFIPHFLIVIVFSYISAPPLLWIIVTLSPGFKSLTDLSASPSTKFISLYLFTSDSSKQRETDHGRFFRIEWHGCQNWQGVQCEEKYSFHGGVSWCRAMPWPQSVCATCYFIKYCEIYLIARKTIIVPSMSLMAFWGTNFWNRAPRYMPTNPPAPKRKPSSQSGEVAIPAFAGMML